MSHAPLAFRPYLDKAASGLPLTEDESRAAFGCIMQGGIGDIELSAFLIALKVRGETASELTGAALAMRNVMTGANAPEGAVDIVGTGGDAKGTLNVSTAAAFVVAGGGVPVAKHGNRAVSSKSGSADVLEKLGVDIAMPPSRAKACFERAGLVFLWAPQHHPAMRHAAAVRAALKMRTIFNLLGPLGNPARTKRQLIGTYAPGWLHPMAEAMRKLGAERVWVVHGKDGMDELSTTGVSRVAELKDGEIRDFEIHPADAGLGTAHLSSLQGGSPEENAASIVALLGGKKGAFRDIVIFNSAAAFVIAGKVADLHAGAALAASSLDEGRAARALEALVVASNGEDGRLRAVS